MRSAALLLLAALVGCTTSFDVSSLPARDAGRDAPESSLDADVPAPDAPLVDVTSPDVTACGEDGQRCCTSAATPCAPGTVCNEGRCQRCPGATSACGGVCVDLQANLNHCGACGHACEPGLSCRAGACVLACPDPLSACDGACVDLSRNLSHCGGCGRACPAGQLCEGGTCGVLCGAREVLCAGACVDTAASVTNCGGCGSACRATNGTPTCASGRCAVLACNEGFADCDRAPDNGCETPITSIASCGACGNACQLPHAYARCTAGACAVESCEESWSDCDGVATNGCEVQVALSTAHCGRCNSACPTPPTGRATCINGVCGAAIQTCPAGRADCDGMMANGCETDITTATNCGGCGIACVIPRATAACVNGGCAIGTCDAGFANCDGSAANGCETDTRNTATSCGACGRACAFPHAAALCVASACVRGACEAGFEDCDGNAANGCETDTRGSLSHCGRCGNACAAENGTPACVQGQCAIASCRAGFANCDGNAANGCETRTSDDVANCGLCGNACVRPNAMTRCEAGACRVASCLAGFADCNGDPADGCETNLGTSTQHCGACNRACAVANGTGVCQQGQCAVASCAAGWANCDNGTANGCETNVGTSTQHCGACNRACATAQVCVAGACQSGCAPPRTVCGNGCVDLQSDVANCGACGRACQGGANGAAACVGGACVLQCAAGYGDCDGNASNGCEANLGASPANCGRCGNACPAGANAQPTCAAGACGYACATGYGDCDPRAPGCETDLRSAPNSCGACGRRCPRPDNALETCVNGACGYACNAGRGDCNGSSRDGCEVDLFSDSASCGRCGVQCVGALDVSCRGGACALCRNADNFATCGATRLCSIDLSTNASHCGGCDQACPSNGTVRNHATYNGVCDTEVCRMACAAAWGDCDTNWQNGCESNLSCDSFHCGGCGMACGAGQVCCESRCVSATEGSRCNLNAPGCR